MSKLPGLNGWAVLRRVRDGMWPVPIVLMSVDPYQRRAATQAQASGYLDKPFDLGDLIHTMERFTRRQG
jgi:DNA-binding response OmpR family regulator